VNTPTPGTARIEARAAMERRAHAAPRSEEERDAAPLRGARWAGRRGGRKAALLAALAAAALAQPVPLLACAACYGQSDSPLAQGMNWGIATLLGFIVCVLAGIGLFFVHIGRRTAAARDLPPAEPSHPKS
jgi:hypothetical protein